MSLGGWWPEYSYVRYYWYPSHSFWWYGYEPVAQEVQSDTYNYYTYNYYGQQDTGAGYSDTGSSGVVDHTTSADMREKLAKQQAAGPAAETLADTLFDEGVKAFEKCSYEEAGEKFAKAMELAPEDMILPFAYGQALFAEGRYNEAADMLRIALAKVSPDKQGVFYPRGLYVDENLLIEQIDRLAQEAAKSPSDTNLQLLLGYHWLGIGEAEKCIEPLTTAKQDNRNLAAATVLLDLAEKIKSGASQ